MFFSTLLWIAFGIAAFVALALLYTVPAWLTVPHIREGLKEMTIEEAVAKLRTSGKKNWELVEVARQLVGERMQYCRRNNLESYRRAFRRGLGFCQQRAYALRAILRALGFEAYVVHSFRNRFPKGKIGGHAWLKVTHEGMTRDVDPEPTFMDSVYGNLHFTSITKVLPFTELFRYPAGWGAAVYNAHIYYMTGQDE